MRILKLIKNSEKIMENQSNCSVFLRIRPPKLWEVQSPLKSFIDYDNSTNKLLVVENQPFYFDNIFNSDSRQKDIFESVENSIESMFNGFNVSILAYGSSGTGKTYTMGMNDGDFGLIPSCLDRIFTKLVDSKDEVKVNISYIEIYNEKVYDLFLQQTNSILAKGSKFAGSTKVQITSTEDARNLLVQATKNRHIRSTQNNFKSSRSHALITVYLHIRSENSEISSVLHMVDLAGSEGLRTTNHLGMAQKEGIFINQGLLSLGTVIQSLSSGKKLIQYRDSVLTTVLADCLNLNSYITLFACISPARRDKSETLSTIRFAQKCKNLEAKIVPEMNSYLKEKQVSKNQTLLLIKNYKI